MSIKENQLPTAQEVTENNLIRTVSDEGKSENMTMDQLGGLIGGSGGGVNLIKRIKLLNEYQFNLNLNQIMTISQWIYRDYETHEAIESLPDYDFAVLDSVNLEVATSDATTVQNVPLIRYDFQAPAPEGDDYPISFNLTIRNDSGASKTIPSGSWYGGIVSLYKA